MSRPTSVPSPTPTTLSIISDLNWCGYVTNSSLNTVEKITASWKIPYILVQPLTGYYFISTWVGIDGEYSPTVEQIGVVISMQDGGFFADCFYEMYPDPPVYFNLAIQAGDLMTGTVEHITGNQFALTLINNTRNLSFGVTATAPLTALRDSAECIVEAPTITIGGGSPYIPPYLDFSKVDFSNASTRISGVTSPIGASPLLVNNITSGINRCEISKIIDSNSGFTVTKK